LTQTQIEKVDQVFHKLLWLDVVETSMLTDLIQERLGRPLTPKQKRQLQLATNARVTQQQDAVSATTEVVVEAAAPKAVSIKLVGYDEKQKIKVIKEVRSVAGLGLKEAKELVESKGIVKSDISVDAANELKEKLEAAGASIEIV
jgi:large subunit ribosomal protein L7/L12